MTDKVHGKSIQGVRRNIIAAVIHDQDMRVLGQHPFNH
jgi:hypothetical protein